MRRLLILIAAAVVLVPGVLMAQGELAGDDAISRLLRLQDDATKKLPVAPPKPLPDPVAGPTVGTKPNGPLPVVMSARIGEHEDRTRLVIELSDPVNLRAFALANPDRVVIDMPQVSWRRGRQPRRRCA